MTQLNRVRRDDEFDKWFYDLGALASLVTSNREASKNAIKAIRVLAGFTLLCVVLLAWRNENILNRLETNQAEQCKNATANASRINDILERVVFAVGNDQRLTPEQRDAQVKQYTDARLELPVCD